ncbi:MAG: hypothetical protein ACLFRL_01240 [Desulfohalobiaceae bacterium]
MQVLHILKSKPEQLVSDLTRETCRDQECRSIELYRGGVDWDQVLQEIFAADKVICWW